MQPWALRAAAVMTALLLLAGLALAVFSGNGGLATDSDQQGGDVAAGAEFPSRPIRIIVYTSPGGLIDLTARRFAEIARKYHSDTPFVVINRPGGGGIVAFEEGLRRPADGHTLLAVTRSNISKLVETGREDLIDAIDWHSWIMDNPHVLITNTRDGHADWDSLYQAAREASSGQLWLGADIGGVKHVSGVKMARQLGIDMRWIPFGSGGEARAALLGNLGAAYLGNPRDALGSDTLDVAVVAAEERMERFPDAPTFRELGFDGLEQENIWRGLALRKGVPESRRQWYAELIEQVTSDPDWIEGWQGEAVNLGYKDSEAFADIVAADRAEFRYYLREIGLLREPGSRESLLAGVGEAPARQFLAGSLVLVNLLLAGVVLRSRFRDWAGELLILAALASLGVLFFLLSNALPPASPADPVGAAGVPRLWVYLLLPLALWQVALILRGRSPTPDQRRPTLLFLFLACFIGYVLLIPVLGYLLASLLYLPLGLWLLGYRTRLRVALLAAGWAAFALIVFQYLLNVDLPGGIWTTREGFHA